MPLSMCIGWPATLERYRWTAALLAAAACGSSATGPSTGNLTVTIDAPGGVTPAVTVSGPGGYSKLLATTTALTGLAIGSYTVAAAPVTTTDAIVGTTYITNVTGSPVTVKAGGLASATANYFQLGGSGGLWIANYNTNQSVVQFSASQLAGTISGPGRSRCQHSPGQQLRFGV